jgi:signal transduction histidine kinase
VEHSSEHVEIDLTVETTDEVIIITVTDTGPGIPPQEMMALEADETDLDHGSGLGLRLVQWLVDHYDSSITFADREPRGTVVSIELPRSTPTDGPAG